MVEVSEKLGKPSPAQSAQTEMKRRRNVQKWLKSRVLSFIGN